MMHLTEDDLLKIYGMLIVRAEDVETLCQQDEGTQRRSAELREIAGRALAEFKEASRGR